MPLRRRRRPIDQLVSAGGREKEEKDAQKGKEEEGEIKKVRGGV